MWAEAVSKAIQLPFLARSDRKFSHYPIPESPAVSIKILRQFGSAVLAFLLRKLSFPTGAFQFDKYILPLG